jgi:ABC-2 type transport system ATP-binding protein
MTADIFAIQERHHREYRVLDVTSAQLFKFLLEELAADGKMILYISHVLESVEKSCAQVVIIYKGAIRAADSVENLRKLMELASLEEIFSRLAEQRDLEQAAKDIVAVMKG